MEKCCKNCLKCDFIRDDSGMLWIVCGATKEKKNGFEKCSGYYPVKVHKKVLTNAVN